MDSIKIGGYDVMFPFKPYPLQKAYMSQVIKCLREKKNGLLESPTGTGKTLSLLCSTLSWLEKQNMMPVLDMMSEKTKTIEDVDELLDISCNESSVPLGKSLTPPDKGEDKLKGSSLDKATAKVLYSSRTHAQLSQACKEMKRTYYRHMSGIVIGGRDNLCINEEVRKLESSTAKTHACRAKTAAKQCAFHNNYEKKVLTTPDFVNASILDIEDLVMLGKKHKICPYYATRVLKPKADVIFMPYNYLLEPSARKALNIEISNNVVIFDEGHNIERICEDSVSGELKSETLEYLIKELKTLSYTVRNSNVMENMSVEALDALNGLKEDNISYLRDVLVSLQEEIIKVIEGTEEKKVHPQKWIFELLDTVGITFEKRKKIFEVIEEVMGYTIAVSLIPGTNNLSAFSAHLQKLNDFFLIIFPDGYDDEKSWTQFKLEFVKKYRVFTEKADEDAMQAINTQSVKKFKSYRIVPKKAALEKEKSWTLYLWCLSASIALNNLQKQGAHCIIITSGTLAPLNSFQIELELPFPVTLQNRHVIDQSQIGIYVIRSSYNGITFNTSYDNRSNMEHVRAVGQSIVHFCRIIPDGVLLFFSSYSVMNNMLKIWKEKDREWKIYSSLCTEKHLFEEPKNKNEFAYCIEDYKQKVDAPKSKGAIFMGVCRGKLSEGLDMADQYCRGVLMIGLPFPAVADPRVIIKRQYLQEMNNRELQPSEWYTLQMKRALNQAIGRIVRNKDDYGVVLLIDTRFERHITGLSKWMHPFVQIKTHAEASQTIQAFFQRHQNKENNDIILS